jgi:membrane-associated protein
VHLLANPIAPDTLLSSFGLVGLAVILFAECGLLIGFFLPGDTLLLSAGVSLAVGTIHTPLAAFLIVAPIAAVAGNLVGYWIGYRAGPAVFNRPQSRLFRPEFVARSEQFYRRFGWATIFLARFVPIVRTVATVMAGVSRMRLASFVVASVLGGVVWTIGILLLGYSLGHIDFVRSHKGWIDYAVIVMVLLSLLPTGIHFLHSRRRRNAAPSAPANSPANVD